jgi:hypothetical protein
MESDDSKSDLTAAEVKASLLCLEGIYCLEVYNLSVIGDYWVGNLVTVLR